MASLLRIIGGLTVALGGAVVATLNPNQAGLLVMAVAILSSLVTAGVCFGLAGILDRLSELVEISRRAATKPPVVYQQQPQQWPGQ